MPGFTFGYAVACLLLLNGGSPVPTNGSAPIQEVIAFEEYIIEHEISAEDARNAAMAIDLASIVIPPGCQKCTPSEIAYCQGTSFINDHCCCDKRYNEVLRFIPHTCYLGTQLCKPVVGDCIKYKRLRQCCCNEHALRKWKSGASAANKPSLLLALGLSFWLYYRCR